MRDGRGARGYPAAISRATRPARWPPTCGAPTRSSAPDSPATSCATTARRRASFRAPRAMVDLGRDFGGGLTEAEVTHLMQHEFARTAADAVWRRIEAGLRMS